MAEELSKYGILGGTFDPPHAGHLLVAQTALRTLGLDEITFIPTAKNPTKYAMEQESPRRRLAMTRLLIADQDQMTVSDIEITRGGNSFTIETLEELLMIRPGQYWVIMGSDSLDGFYHWKAPERIIKLARLAVILRPPHDFERALRNVPVPFHDAIDFIEMPPSSISSTHIRGECIRGLVPTELLTPGVAAYIEEHNLYGLNHSSNVTR